MFSNENQIISNRVIDWWMLRWNRMSSPYHQKSNRNRWALQNKRTRSRLPSSRLRRDVACVTTQSMSCYSPAFGLLKRIPRIFQQVITKILFLRICLLSCPFFIVWHTDYVILFNIVEWIYETTMISRLGLSKILYELVLKCILTGLVCSTMVHPFLRSHRGDAHAQLQNLRDWWPR